MAHKQSLNLPDGLYGWIKESADRDNISISARCNQLLSIAQRCIEEGHENEELREFAEHVKTSVDECLNIVVQKGDGAQAGG